MVMIYKTHNNACIIEPWETSHRQKEPSNKGKLCHVIWGWPLVSICCEESNFGQKLAKSNVAIQANLRGHCFSRQGGSASACLLQFKTLFFLFLPIPTSWNKSSVSVCSRDSHSLCQETCESDAFIFEGMCLCRKPTPIRVTLTQCYSNLQTHRGGVTWWKGFLGYTDQGDKVLVLPLVGLYSLHPSPLCALSLISSLEQW